MTLADPWAGGQTPKPEGLRKPDVVPVGPPAAPGAIPFAEPAPSSEAAQALYKVGVLEKRVKKLENQIAELNALVRGLHDQRVKPKRSYGRRGLTLRP